MFGNSSDAEAGKTAVADVTTEATGGPAIQGKCQMADVGSMTRGLA